MDKNQKEKKLNIIWIIVDSIRNRPSNDKYGKLDIMQRFANDGVEFTTAVSSAVSTSMSVSAMISSRPAYYISRDYETFEYDKTTFPPLTDILKSNGYNNYTIHHYPTTRKKMKGVFDFVPPVYWSKKINKHKLWNEEEMNSIFLKLIKKGLKEPFFLFIHYDVPFSNGFASEKVGLVLRKLKEKNFYDNSIIILCSDHGYPSPTRAKLSLKQKILEGHDLLVTDDNIMIPLTIKYPGCPKGHKITEMVSSLDIAPTILSILSSPYKKYGFEGLNLLKLIDGEKTVQRKIRTDTRYCFQPKRVTSLRSNKYKYINYPDRQIGQREEFFDIKNDKEERKNLIYSKNKEIINKIDEFRKELVLSEEKSVELQKNYLRRKFKHLLNSVNIKKTKKILVFGTSNTLFINITLNNITQFLEDASIDVIIKKDLAKKLELKSKRINFIFSNLTYKDFRKRLNSLRKTRYDLIIIPLANYLGIGYQQIFRIARKIKANKTIKVDYNMDLIKEPNMWMAILKDLRKDFITKLFDWKNFAGSLVLLAKRIIFEKHF